MVIVRDVAAERLACWPMNEQVQVFKSTSGAGIIMMSSQE